MKLSRILDHAPLDLEGVELVCGVDEVGRGCVAGPVVTAAVILPRGFSSKFIRDSKKLTELQRRHAYDLIMKEAIAVNCTHNSARDIDAIGINPATFVSFSQSVEGLSVKPTHILIDGTEYQGFDDYKVETVIKGDDTYSCIAAASIIAKVRRDDYMIELAKQFPMYLWEKNKGYFTRDHLLGVQKYGINQYHRKTFMKNYI